MPARPSDTSRRRAGGCAGVREPGVRRVHRRLVDRPRREQAHDHGLGALARPPLPHVGHVGEVALDVGVSSARCAGCENPLMIASFTAFGSSSSCTARSQARSFASVVGISASARSACRCPVERGVALLFGRDGASDPPR